MSIENTNAETRLSRIQSELEKRPTRIHFAIALGSVLLAWIVSGYFFLS